MNDRDAEAVRLMRSMSITPESHADWCVEGHDEMDDFDRALCAYQLQAIFVEHAEA